MRVTPLIFAFGLTGLLWQSVAADSSLDLSRVTPVPADQPVPIMDFFRPNLLQEPKLNPSGTHLAAIVTAGEDKHQLMVYELKSKKIEIFGAGGDNDIYSVNWLNDRRVIFSLGTQKIYGIGLFAAEVDRLREGYPLLQYYGSKLVSVRRPIDCGRLSGIATTQSIPSAILVSRS